MANDTFTALAHPIRREIVQRISGGATTVGEASRGLGVTKPTISRHLRLLEEAGVVTRMVEGRTEPAAWRWSSTLGIARKRSGPDIGEPARGLRRVGEDALGVELQRPTAAHQLLAIDEDGDHVGPARGVDEVGLGIVPGQKPRAPGAHSDDVGPLARLSSTVDANSGEFRAAMRVKIAVRGRLLLAPGTRHAGASSESGRALSRTTVAASRDSVNERFGDDDSNQRPLRSKPFSN